jgi:hypothetical protein
VTLRDVLLVPNDSFGTSGVANESFATLGGVRVSR